jgi:1,4-alpha-glucan branching enzyme
MNYTDLQTLKELARDRTDIEEQKPELLSALDNLEETIIQEHGELPDVFVQVDQQWKDVLENGWDDTNESLSADLQDSLDELEETLSEMES